MDLVVDSLQLKSIYYYLILMKFLYFREFYDISNELPAHCLLTRCKEGKKKNIYLTSPEVRDLVMKNAEKFKIINTGVKTFVRCDTKGMKCNFRLAQEVSRRKYLLFILLLYL